ncbi:hypothetical protein Tsubulata_010866 [Turnera subulata]|uniref:CCHC-type domain-containing protein n=1 Tax=Turnera subulata TaxID=218843 RepID=A0A9Q0JBX3_9ROSI|nr:hypothetical protein Tsubulata_010866 [Turnera subulata]
MKMVWKLAHDMEISQLDSNLFVFQFFHWRDRERVLENEPWNFDNQLVILSEISGHEQPSEICLDHVPMWVRVYDVPFNLRKPKFIELLGEKVGSFLELDMERSLTQGKFIRFKTSIDVSRPLLRGSFVQGGDGKKVWVYFKYERLPLFCFHCGCMGHIAKDCPAVDDDDFMDPCLFQYSDKLRASPLRRPQLVHSSGAPVTKVKRKLVFKPAGQDFGKQTIPTEDVLPGILHGETPSTGADMVLPRNVPNVTPKKPWSREAIVADDSPLGSTVVEAQTGRYASEGLEVDTVTNPTALKVMLIPGLQSPISLLSGSLASTLLSSPIQLGCPVKAIGSPVVSDVSVSISSGVGDK